MKRISEKQVEDLYEIKRLQKEIDECERRIKDLETRKNLIWKRNNGKIEIDCSPSTKFVNY